MSFVEWTGEASGHEKNVTVSKRQKSISEKSVFEIEIDGRIRFGSNETVRNITTM